MHTVTWDDVPLETIGEGVARRVLWGAKGTYARLSLAKGIHVAKHRHPAEQFTSVISGAMRLDVGGEQLTLRPGDLLVIPADVEHEAWMLEDTVVCDFFAPPRDDWRAGENRYLLGC